MSKNRGTLVTWNRRGMPGKRRLPFVGITDVQNDKDVRHVFITRLVCTSKVPVPNDLRDKPFQNSLLSRRTPIKNPLWKQMRRNHIFIQP